MSPCLQLSQSIHSCEKQDQTAWASEFHRRPQPEANADCDGGPETGRSRSRASDHGVYSDRATRVSRRCPALYTTPTRLFREQNPAFSRMPTIDYSFECCIQFVHEALVCISLGSLEHLRAGRVVREVPDQRCMRHENSRNVARFYLFFTCLIDVSDYIPCDLAVVRSKLRQCDCAAVLAPYPDLGG
jgi:hypothetical protein